jgi:hypothetical protein
MSNDYLKQASERQKKYNEEKKKKGYKKIQVYIPLHVYERLQIMKENRDLNFSDIVEAGINSKFRTWGNNRIYKRY